MAVSSAQYTITTTPQIIALGDGAGTSHIHSASGTVYLGGSDVTTSTGYRMDNGDKQVLDTHESSIYAVSGSGSQTLFVLNLSK